MIRRALMKFDNIFILVSNKKHDTAIGKGYWSFGNFDPKLFYCYLYSFNIGNIQGHMGIPRVSLG